VEYYSAIKKSEILSFVAKWIELEGIMLNEIIKTQEDNYHMSFLICGSYKKET
jgi:hypothetical protein